MKLIVFLCLYAIFAASQRNATESYSCFKSLDWGDNYLVRRHSEKFGAVFLFGKIKDSQETVYGQYFNKTQSYHFLATYQDRIHPDAARMMVWVEYYQGFTYGIRRSKPETFWDGPKPAIFVFDCKASKGKDGISNAITNGTEQEYSCFKSKTQTNRFYYKRDFTDPRGNHYYVGYSIPRPGAPRDGILYGHYQTASDIYTFYVFYNNNLVSVKMWETLGRDRNGIEYLADVLVPERYREPPHEQSFYEC